MADEFDVIVLGGGPTGEHAAGRLRARGLRTAVVEQELVGGECSYWACMPSKTLLRPGRVLSTARNVPGAREAVTGNLDARATLDRRNWITAGWNDSGQADWLESIGATLVRGRGRLAGERTVEVESADGTATLHAATAVILATGSSSFLPPIDGLSATRHWDNRGATAADELPRRLLVLGGGPVGVELAQAWRRIGAEEVTIVEAADRLLGREEPFAGDEVAAALRAEGIEVITGKKVVSVRRENDNAPVTATLDDSHSITADEILVAVGRRPRSEDIGLETVGIEPKGPLPVDDQMRVNGVSGGWLFAIGDLNGRAPLTHMGKYHARVATKTIAGVDSADLVERIGVPRVVFTDPEVAAVGMTEQQAIEAGHTIRTVRCDMSEVAAASIAGERISGTCQLVVDTDTELLLGATFVGPDVADHLQAATMAIVAEVPLEKLRHVVASFPTFSEIWLTLLEHYDEGGENSPS